MARIACIGAGNVGRAWAVVFARAGHQVSLYDVEPDLARTIALPRIAETLHALNATVSGNEDAATVCKRIKISPDIAGALCDADYVQESVREDIDIKRGVFAQIASLAPRDTILASSTSALPGSTFLVDIARPERALVAHPVNPPSHIPLVELCGTGKTNTETLNAVAKLMRQAAMKPIVVQKEIDGFILNRLQYTLVAEAMHLVGEGYCTAEDIDTVMTDGLALRWASIGPFMTAHLNATGGFAGFVEQLGPMMKRMGRDARTNYDWSPEQIAAIHEWLCKKRPVDDIPRAQVWRDMCILATREMQNENSN